VNITNAQDWVKTDITDFASINFPVESELTKTQGETIYFAEDEFAFYIVTIRKLSDQQSSKITQKELTDIYQGVVQGTLDASNAEIVSMNEIILQNIPALELEYYAPANPNLPSQIFKRIIYVNKHIINIDFWTLTDQKDIANEKKIEYFNSFLINLKEVKNVSTIQNDTSDEFNLEYEIGFIIGQIIFYVLLIALLIGIFLLIRYLLKKNKKENKTIHTKEQTHSIVTKIICNKCDSENSSDSKYCSRCGFELTKN
tara:strand:- start:73487 stop:74257 length:771 start_codon:yes stop_codon:yes gene_type:complete